MSYEHGVLSRLKAKPDLTSRERPHLLRFLTSSLFLLDRMSSVDRASATFEPTFLYTQTGEALIPPKLVIPRTGPPLVEVKIEPASPVLRPEPSHSGLREPAPLTLSDSDDISSVLEFIATYHPAPPAAPRKRGRPRKAGSEKKIKVMKPGEPKRKRGRPRKYPVKETKPGDDSTFWVVDSVRQL